MPGRLGEEHGLQDPEPPPWRPVAGRHRRVDLDEPDDDDYVRSVRDAAAIAYTQMAWQPPEKAFSVLARELAGRGIEPDPSAVFDAAVLISRGRRPAVLRAAGEDRPGPNIRG